MSFWKWNVHHSWNKILCLSLPSKRRQKLLPLPESKPKQRSWNPEVRAERRPQPQKEDLHVSHLPVAQDRMALEAAQIPWKEHPGGASLTATPSSNSPNHWVNLEEDRSRQHTAHCGCQGQQGPDQMCCEEALWPWCCQSQHPHTAWQREGRCSPGSWVWCSGCC